MAMEILRRGGITLPMLVVFLTFALLVLTPEAQHTPKRYTVGGRNGWTTNVNYTIWAQSQHFYLGDWLFFIYDRNQMNVLEVNKTDYEGCISDHPLHNWTTGAGRDVVPLNVTRHYYFISGKGYCFGGMKVALHVEHLPPPPTSLPSTNGSPSAIVTRMVVRVASSVAAALALFIPMR